MTEPTKRQLDALAAWWQTGGSSVEAARIMGVTPQVMRNTLMQLRRQEQVDKTLPLALRYREQIERRRILKSKRAA